MSNPAFSENLLDQSYHAMQGEPMTVQGTINKTVLLLLVTVASFFITFRMYVQGNIEMATSISVVSALIGFVLAMIIIFKNKTAPVLAPIYAFLEGTFLGAISASFEVSYPGIAAQAVVCTFGALFSMLFLYTARIIKVTEKFRSVLFIATATIAVIYFVSIILSIFNIQIPHIFSSSPIGIGFSAVVVCIAAFNFLLDFDFIERASLSLAPKHLEWYAGFGLLVTVVWLYLEILKLLGKLRSNR